MNKIARIIIRIYQLAFAPFIPTCCRFAPSCSNYAHEAFSTHRFFPALWLTMKRLVKCGPWHRGGYDPVPGYTNPSK